MTVRYQAALRAENVCLYGQRLQSLWGTLAGVNHLTRRMFLFADYLCNQRQNYRQTSNASMPRCFNLGSLKCI